MELNGILRFLEEKAILVTGGTGFLAKIFIEKVLRTQPDVRKIYLLLRAADDESASLRLQNEVIAKDLFQVLRQKMGAKFHSFVSEKVVVVLGDISCEDLAIKDGSLKEELFNNIDVILNLAATTNFDERYDISLNLNTFGAKYVLDFAKKCPKLKVLVHVSTAYVSGETAGLIKESPYHMGDALNGRPGLNVEEEKRYVQTKLDELQAEGATQETVKITMKNLGLERARHWGWPNVYVFTKALGEMMLMQDVGDLPLVIIRPTIVISTYKEPIRGWGEGTRTLGSLCVAYGKGRLPFFLGDPEAVVDVIPADIVVNAIIVAIEAHANQKGDPTIYQVGSSVSNPVRFTMLHEIAFKYFTKYPLKNKDGSSTTVRHVKVLGSMASFKSYVTLRYILPLKALAVFNVVFCQLFRGTYTEMSRKLNQVMRLIGIFRPYLFFKGTYDDTNTEMLRAQARDRELETDIFYFDPKAVEWEDYFYNICIPGMVKYIIK